MRKVMAVLSLVLILFAFVACSDDSGSSGGTAPAGMSAAELKIYNKYGSDVFYFAELADIAGSYSELVEAICGADADARASAVSRYSSFGMQISNASDTTVSFRFSEDGNTVTVDITNVRIEPSRGLNDSISYDAGITVSGAESHSAQVSLEIDLVNNTTTITQGRYKSIVFGTGSDALSQANSCLAEIMALDDSGEGSGADPHNPGPYNPGPGQGDEWTMGTASLPAHTAREIALALEGIDFFVRIEEPQGGVGVNDCGVSYFYEYGIIHDGESGNAVQLWAKRWDELPAQFDQESQYDMIAMDRIPEHQFLDANEEKMSDYIFYEDDAYSNAWTLPDTAVYHDDDGSRNWQDAVVFWVYDGEDIFSEAYAQYSENATYAGGIYYHYSDLVKPYRPDLLAQYNGHYEKLSRKATVAGIECSIYRYAGELYYIADSADLFNACLKHTWLAQGKEYVMFEVLEINKSPEWPVE